MIRLFFNAFTISKVTQVQKKKCRNVKKCIRDKSVPPKKEEGNEPFFGCPFKPLSRGVGNCPQSPHLSAGGRNDHRCPPNCNILSVNSSVFCLCLQFHSFTNNPFFSPRLKGGRFQWAKIYPQSGNYKSVTKLRYISYCRFIFSKAFYASKSFFLFRYFFFQGITIFFLFRVQKKYIFLNFLLKMERNSRTHTIK